MAPIIDIIRHAEGRNNIGGEGHSLRDPGLTSKGIKQCEELRDTYPHGDKVKWIYVSPLRRTIRTAQLAIEPLVPVVPNQQGKRIMVLLPELQENSARPCDTGSPQSVLEREFNSNDTIDMAALSCPHNGDGDGENWWLKTPESAGWPSLAKVEARARAARVKLRAVARQLADDERIAVVTHGAFAHFLVGDFAGLFPGRGSGVWRNATMRSYRFTNLEDDDVPMEEVDPLPGRDWSALSDEEKARQRSYAVARLLRHEKDGLDVYVRPETEMEMETSSSR